MQQYRLWIFSFMSCGLSGLSFGQGTTPTPKDLHAETHKEQHIKAHKEQHIKGHKEQHIKGHKEQHKAHEHGAAKLSVVLEQKKINIVFESPADSIYGFEKQAQSDNEKKLVAQAVEQFASFYGKMFFFELKADCTLASKTIIPREVEDEKDSHAEFHAELNFDCKNIPKYLDVSLIKAFPKLKNIDAQIIADEKQSAHKINQPTLRLNF